MVTVRTKLRSILDPFILTNILLKKIGPQNPVYDITGTHAQTIQVRRRAEGIPELVNVYDSMAYRRNPCWP
jgi:hypothetical protein